jgi:hypothetical protein
MRRRGIEEFARILVQKVRDPAIESCDANLRAGAKNVIAKRWRAAARRQPDVFAKTIVPDIVDSVVSHLLAAIDQERLRLSFTPSEGTRVDLVKEGRGELSGWYKGPDGWVERYSGERFSDDFSDLERMFLPSDRTQE